MSSAPPWTAQQVANLNEYQRCGWVHPFTCANRSDGNHPNEPEFGDHGVLRATEQGWTCPYCDYLQTWAHDFMFAGAPPHPWPAVAATFSHGRDDKDDRSTGP